MKKILIFLILSVLGIGTGVVYLQHRKSEAVALADALKLRLESENAFDSMKKAYDARLTLLDDVDPEFTRQIRLKTHTLVLTSREGLEQYDYFQNLVSERFSIWLKNPAAHKSTKAGALRSVEIELDRKRADFHRAAFALNTQITQKNLNQMPLAVFQAESVLQHLTSEAAK